MRRMRAVGVLAGVTMILAGGLASATADTVTSTVSGAALASITSGATLSAVTLNGSTQTATGTATQWSIIDARGTGAAWTLSVTATVPTSAAGTIETTARTIPVTDLTITPGPIAAGIGADPAGNITAPALPMSTVAQALISAGGPDKGAYTLTPSFSLAIPANAYRSNYSAAVGSTALNPYTSTLTYTIA
jgi:hypothetical protein